MGMSNAYRATRKNKQKQLTFDDKWEIPINEAGVWDGDASLVEAVVNPLAGSWWHVQDSLHGIFRAAADQVPVHHPLTVLESVPGPHHARAAARQDSLGACREADVPGLHHHTRLAAAALTPGWQHIKKRKERKLNGMHCKKETNLFARSAFLKDVLPPGRRSTARTERHQSTNH